MSILNAADDAKALDPVIQAAIEHLSSDFTGKMVPALKAAIQELLSENKLVISVEPKGQA